MRDRPASRGAQGWAVWVSGRPGSGKTTIVSMLRARLIGRGIPVVVLEVAEFATAIAPGGVPSAKQRAIITRAVIQAAKLLTDAGRAVPIDGAVPHRESGRVARELITNFAHVELACPL